MSCAVIPFPFVRRRAFVVRHALRMAALSSAAAERHLVRQLEIQRQTMQRRGIASVTIAAELTLLEEAVRGATARLAVRGVA